MSFDLLFINGCSHSAGSEIEGSGIGESDYNRENCFGAKLACKLGVKKINLAIPGASNDYIADSTMLWCLNNIEKIQNTYFLIHWTGAERTQFYYKKTAAKKYSDWVFDHFQGHVHPKNYCSSFPKEDISFIKRINKYLFMNEINWEVNKLLNIIRTQTLFRSMGANYAFYNSFTELLNKSRFKKYHKLIDQTNFYNSFDKNQTFYYWALNQGHDINGQMYWHHKEPAHTDWADKLYQDLFNNV